MTKSFNLNTIVSVVVGVLERNLPPLLYIFPFPASTRSSVLSLLSLRSILRSIASTVPKQEFKFPLSSPTSFSQGFRPFCSSPSLFPDHAQPRFSPCKVNLSESGYISS